MATLALPLTDLSGLRHRVAALAENRPAVYRMVDTAGRVIYVGKAKRLRLRLLSYFRAEYPTDKAARILNAAADITWDYVPSEFAALLVELRQIRRFRPVFNVRMNRRRRSAFVKISPGPAPKIYVGTTPGPEGVRHYGPLSSPGRLKDGVRVLNDVLRLRDCSLAIPITFSEQGDLFGPARRAGCLRHALDRCAGPCAGFVTEEAYEAQVRIARDFLDGRTVQPVNRVIEEMMRASERNAFETAGRWRDKLDHLEWLLGACVRARAAVEALTFVYEDPGLHGDDRAYVIRNARVRASAPAPHTPIEREAFRALVTDHAQPEPVRGPIPVGAIDETLLTLHWFRRHPKALNRTVPLERWFGNADAC